MLSKGRVEHFADYFESESSALIIFHGLNVWKGKLGEKLHKI